MKLLLEKIRNVTKMINLVNGCFRNALILFSEIASIIITALIYQKNLMITIKNHIIAIKGHSITRTNNLTG